MPEDAPDETFCCVFISGSKSLMVHDTRLRPCARACIWGRRRLVSGLQGLK